MCCISMVLLHSSIYIRGTWISTGLLFSTQIRTISTIKCLMETTETNTNLPWEEVRGSVEDLIAGLGGLVSATEAKHQKITPVSLIKRHALVKRLTSLYSKF